VNPDNGGGVVSGVKKRGSSQKGNSAGKKGGKVAQVRPRYRELKNKMSGKKTSEEKTQPLKKITMREP